MDKLLVVVLIAAVAFATGYAVRAIFRTAVEKGRSEAGNFLMTRRWAEAEARR